MDEKTCNRCRKTKSPDDFGKHAGQPDGLQRQCNDCRRAYREANKARIAEKDRRYREEQGERLLAQKRAYYEANKDKILVQRRAYYEANKGRLNAWQREYYEANRDRLKAQSREYYEANKDALLAQQAEYRRRNAEKVAAAHREWHRRNRPQILEQKREHYAANKEHYEAYRARNADRIKAGNAEYREANPHVFWKHAYRYRCDHFGVAPVVEDFTRADLIDRYGDSCFYCDTGDFEHLDHFIPVSKGGPHTLENVRPSCAACNLAKSDLDPDEWLAEQATLDDLTEDELDDLIDAEIERWTK